MNEFEEGAEAAAPEEAAAPDPGPPGAGDWREALPEELRGTAGKFASPAHAMRSYAELERRLGRTVTPPEDPADDAAWDRFWQRLGRPETPEGYEIAHPELPEGLERDERSAELEGGFLSAMHRAGAPPGIVQAAFDWYYDMLARSHEARGREDRAAARQAEAGLRREWGRDYDANRAVAERTARRFLGGEAGDALARPGMLRALAEIGRHLGEDGTVTNAKPTPARASLLKELESLRGAPEYWEEATQARVAAIYHELYGEA